MWPAAECSLPEAFVQSWIAASIVYNCGFIRGGASSFTRRTILSNVAVGEAPLRRCAPCLREKVVIRLVRAHKTIVKIVRSYLKEKGVDPRHERLLIIGSEEDDLEIAREVGFVDITQSNLEGFKDFLPLDAENIALPDDSFDVVLTHAVLHHCQSPHKAILECLRVCRKHFLFLEGNDSFLMRMATRFRFHDPFEFSA
jgi:SAM-dependent methyltransferase